MATLSLGPTADAAIGTPDETNYGDNSFMAVGSFLSEESVQQSFRALVRFSLADLGPSPTVTAATLTLTNLGAAGPSFSVANAIRLYRLVQPAWTELGCTWLTYDGVHPWSTPGGDLSAMITSITLANGSDNAVIPGLAATVAAAAASGQIDFCLRLADESTLDSFLIWWASEAGPVVQPYLTITYTGAGAPAPPGGGLRSHAHRHLDWSW